MAPTRNDNTSCIHNQTGCKAKRQHWKKDIRAWTWNTVRRLLSKAWLPGKMMYGTWTDAATVDTREPEPDKAQVERGPNPELQDKFFCACG